MSERLHLQVDDGTADRLTALAGGERQRGRWLSDLIRSMHKHQVEEMGDDLYSLRLSHQGLTGVVKHIDARLARIEHAQSEVGQ